MINEMDDILCKKCNLSLGDILDLDDALITMPVEYEDNRKPSHDVTMEEELQEEPPLKEDEWICETC